MKKLTTQLLKGNLRPKERVLLLMRDAEEKEKTGKEILNDTDRHAIADGWMPENNAEVKEYNQYNKGWQLESTMRLDAQTAFMSAQISLLSANRILDYAMGLNYDDEHNLTRLKKIRDSINESEATDFLLKHSGLVFEDTVYTLAFESLSDELRNDILTLCPDAKTEHQYLDQEEQIASIVAGKDTLSSEDKGRLVDMVDIPLTKYAKIFISRGLPTRDWMLQGYFAELPIIAIAQKWADNNNVLCEEHELSVRLKTYADLHNTTVQELLRRTLRKWLDDGLFITEYQPICNSAGTATCNGADTISPHNEVFAAWMKAKAEARQVLQQLVYDGTLIFEKRTKEIFGVEDIIEVITGESLYSFEGDSRFVEEYKKQGDGMKPLAYLILFMQQCSFFSSYAILLGFSEIYKTLQPLYEIDLEYKLTEYIILSRGMIEDTNHQLQYIAEKLEMSNRTRHDIVFPLELFVNDMALRLDEVAPYKEDTVAHYEAEFRKIFGSEYR